VGACDEVPGEALVGETVLLGVVVAELEDLELAVKVNQDILDKFPFPIYEQF